MDINELQQLMQDTGACIRAIPMRQRSIFEACHADHYPDGKIIFLPEFKRKMLVVESIPKDAGKFLIETGCGTGTTVRFSGKKYYDTLEQAAEALRQTIHADAEDQPPTDDEIQAQIRDYLCRTQGHLFQLAAKRGLDCGKFVETFMNSQTAACFDLEYHPIQDRGEGYVLEELEDETGGLPGSETTY